MCWRVGAFPLPVYETLTIPTRRIFFLELSFSLFCIPSFSLLFFSFTFSVFSAEKRTKLGVWFIGSPVSSPFCRPLLFAGAVHRLLAPPILLQRVLLTKLRKSKNPFPQSSQNTRSHEFRRLIQNSVYEWWFLAPSIDPMCWVLICWRLYLCVDDCVDHCVHLLMHCEVLERQWLCLCWCVDVLMSSD